MNRQKTFPLTLICTNAYLATLNFNSSINTYYYYGPDMYLSLLLLLSLWTWDKVRQKYPNTHTHIKEFRDEFKTFTNFKHSTLPKLEHLPWTSEYYIRKIKWACIQSEHVNWKWYRWERTEFEGKSYTNLLRRYFFFGIIATVSSVRIVYV